MKVGQLNSRRAGLAPRLDEDVRKQQLSGPDGDAVASLALQVEIGELGYPARRWKTATVYRIRKASWPRLSRRPFVAEAMRDACLRRA